MISLFDLKSKIALVTGGGSGLGRSAAIALANAGAKVIVADINIQAANLTKEDISKDNSNLSVKVDVSNSSDVKDMVDEVIKKYKKIDILVNFAGIAKRIPAENMPEEIWDNIINVNLKGTFLCDQYIGKIMIKQKSGSIINIASMSGITANKDLGGQSAYCASKAGVILLTKELATEWTKYNVRVNCISPGYMKTPVTLKTRNNQILYRKMIDSVPMKRYGEPEELAGAIIFLASNASSYVTGCNLIIDGGYTSW